MGVRVRLQLVNMRRFDELVAPAIRALANGGDTGPMQNALLSALAKMDASAEVQATRDGDFGERRPEIEDAIDALDGPGASAPASVAVLREQVVPLLVEVLCLEWGALNPSQDMSDPRLMAHLYAYSDWIEGVFTYRIGITGGTFEFSPGESSQLLSRPEVQRLSAELELVPSAAAGEDALEREIENLRALVREALRDPDLRLLVTVT
jgi:hypothetical protein